MKYQVSDNVKAKFEALTACEKTVKALDFMKEDNDNIIDKQIELTLIPAPTFQEQKKAARLLEMFKEEQIKDGDN